PFLSILPNVNKVYAAETVDAVGNVNQLQFGASQQKFDASQQQLNVKKVLKDEIQRKVSELPTLFTGKGHGNPKVKFIIDKFQSGKKLTPDERAYLSQHAKGVIDHIERVSRVREFVEQRMKAAPSKMDM